MFAFLSASKRLTFTSTFDCFCLQIAILLSYKVTVILKVFPSHYRGCSEGDIHVNSVYIEDITRWREDMNFMFEWQTQYLTSSLRSLVRYCVCHENIKFISSSQRVMFFLLYGDKISEIAHFYSLLVASVEKFFENLQIVQGLLFCVFVVEAFGKLFHLFIV